MGVVGVQRSHHLVNESGFGYANVERHIPSDTNTRFRIGSLSKQFTAAAILLLQQDGKLKTSDPIGRYWKDAPASWSNITLGNLLTHTSGIADSDFGVLFKDSPHRPEELLRLVVAKPLKFRSGTKTEYANINYAARSGGRTGQRRVVLPVADRSPLPAAPSDAASLYSSARDLIRWTEALHAGRVLSKVSLTEMTTPFLNGDGCGLSIDGEGAELDISHTGAIEGFMSSLNYIPATRTTVVVLSNLVEQGNQASPGTFALDTELVSLGIDVNAILPSDRKEAPVAEEILRSYAGHYCSDDPVHPVGITLTFRNDRLFIENDGGVALPLMAESASRFYLTNQESGVVFDPHVPGSFGLLNYAPIGRTAFNGDSARTGKGPEAK